MLMASQRMLHRGMMDAEEESQRVTLPLNDSEPVKREKRGTDYVLVFPLGQSMSGIVNEDDDVENPQERCREIFRQRGPGNKESLIPQELFPFNEPVTQDVFQHKVRIKVLQMLMQYGIAVHGYRSIDHDEMFILLGISKGSEATRNTAKSLDIMARIHPDHVDPCLLRGSDEYPMKNANEEEVPAYMLYDGSERFENFRKIDEIRIIDRVLHECFHTHKLATHHVIEKAFPLASDGHLLGFMDDWANFSCRNAFGFWPPESRGEIVERIRTYYGEYIAFFFMWYANYIRYLIPLAITSVLVLARRLPLLRLPLWWQRYIQIVYTGGVILWATTFNKLTTRSFARSVQIWGTKNIDNVEVHRAEFRPELGGTWSIIIRNIAVGGVMLLYVLVFVGAAALNTTLMSGPVWGKYESIGTTVIIMVFNLGWSSIAPLLANWQNHRTNSRYEEGLVKILAPMKLFLTLVPFLKMAFLRRFTHRTCAPTLAEAAKEVYGTVESVSSWPPVMVWANQTLIGSTQPVWDEDGSLKGVPDLAFLDPYKYTDSAGQACIKGCYPIHCGLDAYGDLHCMSNCSNLLDKSLITFYLSHAACTLAFVIIAIALTKFDIYRERSKHRTAAQGFWNLLSNDEEGKNPETGSPVNCVREEYTLAQLQAKMMGYKYGSWGGSREEDFMELAISFALLTCFSAQVPSMAIPSLICNIAEYRFLAFRMVAVTQRPFPQASEGIGIWQEVFDAICFCAVIVNCALFVFSQSPMDHANHENQYIWFIALENVGILLAVGVSIFMSSMPLDVRNIAESYSRLVARIRFSDAGGSEGETHRTLPVGSVENKPKETTLDEQIVKGLRISDGMRGIKRRVSYVQSFRAVACGSGATESGSESSSSEGS
eukprot:TRINITY_DN248_c0_g1_i3.p1 TRINITY_DN248_c0_g1~~TRINITY_DN248_c0_g1_i3.p1  ORF type:complete len:893 (+),score=78.77 TRINITY_DN248_c0_g1_i3:29-2680(+)